MALREQIHYTSRWGDAYILLSPIKWGGWEYLKNGLFNKFYSLWGFFFALLGSFLSFITELFALSVRVPLRIRHGKNALGILIMCAATLNLAIINNEKSFAAYFEFFSALFRIIHAIFTDFSTVNLVELKAALWQPESIALEVLLFLFLGSGLVQVVGLYFLGWRNDNPFKKGVPLIYLLLHKTVRLKEAYYSVLFEPALIYVVGYIFIFYLDDLLFGTYLFFCASSLFLQEFIDYLMRQTFGK